jgi:hypothetical protein
VDLSTVIGHLGKLMKNIPRLGKLVSFTALYMIYRCIDRSKLGGLITLLFLPPHAAKKSSFNFLLAITTPPPPIISPPIAAIGEPPGLSLRCHSKTFLV